MYTYFWINEYFRETNRVGFIVIIQKIYILISNRRNGYCQETFCVLIISKNYYRLREKEKNKIECWNIKVVYTVLTDAALWMSGNVLSDGSNSTRDIKKIENDSFSLKLTLVLLKDAMSLSFSPNFRKVTVYILFIITEKLNLYYVWEIIYYYLSLIYSIVQLK